MYDPNYSATLEAQTMATARRQEAEERGRAALGLARVNRPWTEGGSFWERRGAPQTHGLPALLLAEAQAAYENETQARRALEHAEAQANAYADAHRLDAQTRHTHLHLQTAEARTALRAAAEHSARAAIDLGLAAMAIAEAQAQRADLPRRRAAAEAAYKRTMAELDAIERQATGVLSTYGLA